MSDFKSIDNVPFDWTKRLQELDDYLLVISDYYWMLMTGDYCEFYYNPCYFMGKIARNDIPDSVIQRIKMASVSFSKGSIGYGKLPEALLDKSSVRLRELERYMDMGNWFHAQGQNYVTWRGRFICDDMYVEGLERECLLNSIDGHIVYDMLRMCCRTRTPNYINTIFDLPVFSGVDISKMIILPFKGYEWDSAEWLKYFKVFSDTKIINHNPGEVRNMRAQVFQHTVAVIRNGHYTLNGVEYWISEDCTRAMIEGTHYYDTPLDASLCPKLDCETEVAVINTDCLNVAKAMQENGYNVAVLNMASRQNPGGGVLKGAGAQEESLFRRTNLFQSMYQYAPYANQYGIPKNQKQYPLDRQYGGIYTPDAIVIRGEEKQGYPLLGEDSYCMSFISVPAINRPNLKDARHLADNMAEGMKNKMRTILRIGLLHGHDALVLGAFGCGAFRNPPSHVARLFREVFDEPEFKNKYRRICFAILEDHNSHKTHNPEGNYLPFVKEFK